MVRLPNFLQRLTKAPAVEEAEPEPPSWKVGSRYEVLRPIQLVDRPDFSARPCGKLEPESLVLVLALCAILNPNDEEVLVAYLAYTRGPKWICGWGQVAGPGLLAPVGLASRSMKGSWEVGGRYRVRGQPVLRPGVELEGEALCELNSEEEVLVLEVGLVIIDKEPRLRARVRVDQGDIGWMTVELPGSGPFLERLNLYSEDAVLQSRWCFSVPTPLRMTKPRNSARRITQHRKSVCGASESFWNVGGKYRTLTKLMMEEDATWPTMAIGTLGAGKLVVVQDIRNTGSLGAQAGLVRLQVIPETGRFAGRCGWINGIDMQGQFTLDLRNHLELEELLQSGELISPMPSQNALCQDFQTKEFTVVLDRPPGASIGADVVLREGKALFIQSLAEEGAFITWNKDNPDSVVLPGDQILAVSGQAGSAQNMIACLREAGEKIEVTILRDNGNGTSQNATQGPEDFSSSSLQLQGLVDSAQQSATSLDPCRQYWQKQETREEELMEEPWQHSGSFRSTDSHSFRNEGSSPVRRRRRSRTPVGSPDSTMEAPPDAPQSDKEEPSQPPDPPRLFEASDDYSSPLKPNLQAEVMEELRAFATPAVSKHSPVKEPVCKESPPKKIGLLIRDVDQEPDWLPFFDGAGGDDAGNESCPCRETNCRDGTSLFGAWFGCGGSGFERGFKVLKEQFPQPAGTPTSAGALEPAPEPRSVSGY